MVTFNELRFNHNGDELIIDVEVPESEYGWFDNQEISRIVIVNYKDFNQTKSYDDYDEDEIMFDTFNSSEFDVKDDFVNLDGDTVNMTVWKGKNNRFPNNPDVEADDHNVKHIRITLNKKDFGFINECDFNKKLFYIYVVTTGDVDESEKECPIDLQNDSTIGIVCNGNTIYRTAIRYVKQLSRRCDIPKSFIDFILNYEAFKLAIRTDDYLLINETFARIAGDLDVQTECSCNCNG